MTSATPRTSTERQRDYRARHKIQSIDLPGEVTDTLRAIRDASDDPSMTAALVRLIKREAKRLKIERTT